MTLTLPGEEGVAVSFLHLRYLGSTEGLYGGDQILGVFPQSFLTERKHPHHLPVRYGWQKETAMQNIEIQGFQLNT